MVFLFGRDHGNQSEEAKITYACLGKPVEEKLLGFYCNNYYTRIIL